MGKVTVMVGLSGSGKSTRAKRLAEKDGSIILSSDEIRKELTGNISDQSQNGKVFEVLHKRYVEALKCGENICIDATNLTPKERHFYISEGKRYGASVCAYIVNTCMLSCVARDNLREEERRVGIDVIIKQHKRFCVPFYEEGWDDIVFDVLPKQKPGKTKIKMQMLDKYFELYNQDNPYHVETLKEHSTSASHRFKSLYNYPEEYNIAAYWHDIGKIQRYVKTFDEEKGYSTYHGHANVGAYAMMTEYYDILVTKYPVLQDKDKFLNMLFLINYHMEPFNMDFSSEKSARKIRSKFKDRLQILLDFNECDKLACIRVEEKEWENQL